MSFINKYSHASEKSIGILKFPTNPSVLIVIFLISLTASAQIKRNINLPFPVKLVSFASQTAPPVIQTTQLRLGQTIKRPITGGETHFYTIAVAAGDFLNISALQNNCWLTLSLRAPDGNLLSEVEDTPTAWNSARLLSIAESSGQYSLEIKTHDDYATAGNYEIRIEEMRTATAEDRTRVRADETFLKAYILDERQETDDSRRSLDLYQDALRLFRERGDRAAEAKTLYKIGWIYRDVFGEMQKSLENFDQSLAASRDVGDRKGEFQALHFIGATYSYQGDYQKAIDYKTEALKIARETEDAPALGYTFHELGFIYGKLGEYQKALDYDAQALNIWRATANKRDLARTLVNVGGIYVFLGEQTEAIDYFEQALAIERAGNDRWGQPSVLYSIGAAYENLGDREKALDYYSRSLTVAGDTGMRAKEAVALMRIGSIYLASGKIEQSRDYLNRALAIFRVLNDRADEAQTLEILGNSFALSAADAERAFEFYNQAITISSAVKDRARQAETLYFLASLEHKQNKFADALPHIELAISFVELMREELTNNDLRASYLATVQDYYHLRTDILMRLDEAQPNKNFNALAFESAEKARARSFLDLLNESRANVRQGVDASLLEREKTLRQNLAAKSSYQTHVLGDKHTPEQETTIAAEIKKLGEDYDQTETEIRAKSPRYAALTQPKIVSVKDLQSQILDRDTLLLEYALGGERSFLWVVGQDSVKSFELPKREEIERLARRVYEILTTRNQNPKGETDAQKSVRIERAERDYAEAAANLSRMILAPAAAILDNKRLLIVADGALQYVPFAALPSPKSKVESSKSVAGRSVKNLNSLETKPNFGQFLIETNEIVYLPSASTLAVLRGEERTATASDSIAIVADPVFAPDDLRVAEFGKANKKLSNNSAQTVAVRNQNAANERGSVERAARETGLENFPRLRFSRDEAEAISAIAPRRNLMEAVDFAASKQTVESANFGKHRIIHFATHGLIDSQNPELSGVVLSLVDENGNPQDGFLRLFEIYNLKLESDLVVLSACRTALGKDVRGEGLIGLTRGFMYAGAPRVAASLWSIDDRATAELMKRFYARMLREKMSPANALRSAQMEMLKNARWRNPYYWAAFTLQGEWR